MSCQPARGDPLGPGTPELAFSDNPLIYSACLGMAASDREVPGQVLSGDLAGKMKPGWGVRACRGGGHGLARDMGDGETISDLGKAPLAQRRVGAEHSTVSCCCHQCSFVPAGLSSWKQPSDAGQGPTMCWHGGVGAQR